MSLLPASTNADYRGAASSAWFLVIAGCLTIVPGCIHYFLPDGGAGVIAGIDLAVRGDTIVAVFAWMGAVQIPYGIAHVVVGLRYRTLVPLFLLLIVLERTLMTVEFWIAPGHVPDHRPPEHYATLAAVALATLFLGLSLRRS